MKSNLSEKTNQSVFNQKVLERKERIYEIAQLIIKNESAFVKFLKQMIKKDW